GVGVHVVATPRLAGSAVAAAVVRDAAVAALRQKQHLVFEGIRAEWPAMAEDYGLSLAPVLVVDLSSVFGCDGGHKMLSSSDFSSRDFAKVLQLPPTEATLEKWCRRASRSPECCRGVFSQCAEPCRDPGLYPRRRPWL